MEKFEMISISEIQKNPYQPRKEFDVEKLKELAQSIKENGLIQPIIVRQSPVIGCKAPLRSGNDNSVYH